MLNMVPTVASSMWSDLAKNDSIVYVWDFSVSDTSIKKIGVQLTNDFETELINSGLYTVLERRRYNRVLAHQNLEKKIAEIQNLSDASIDSLKAIRAGAVIFGEVKDDIDSGVYEVTVTFQSLNQIILRKGSILIGRGLIADNQTRKNAMKELVNLLHTKEILAAKKEQYESVSKILATYLVRVKDIQKGFQDVAGFALENQLYYEELAQRIFEYNDIFDEIHNNGATIQMDFAKQWKEPRGEELRVLFGNILDDIHKTHILKLDKVRMAIWEFERSTAGKSEKRKMKDEIIKNVKETTDDLERQINIIEPKISTFLSHLRVEMSSE